MVSWVWMVRLLAVVGRGWLVGGRCSGERVAGVVECGCVWEVGVVDLCGRILGRCLRGGSGLSGVEAGRGCWHESE